MSEKNKLQIITGWDSWQDSSLTLYVKENGETKEKIIENVDWYFVIKTSDFERLGVSFFSNFNNNVSQQCIYKIKKQDSYVRLYCKGTTRDRTTQLLVNVLKEQNVEVFEADLSRLKRFLIDSDVEIAENLKVLYFDIETDDSGQGIEIGRDRIVSWAACDDAGNTFFECLDDEKELLKKFLILLDSYDIFTGWNSEHFDLPYIQKRMAKYSLQYDWRKKIHLDMMKRCIKVYSYEMDKVGLTGFSLNEFSRVFLQDKKVEHTESILELFKTNREKLKEYNIHDVELLRALEKKLEIIKLMIHSCHITGALLNRFYVGELLDMYILKKSKPYNLHFPSKTAYGEVNEYADVNIIGGFVRVPTVGIYSDVRIFDFKSLYPSIIVSWNISADSIDKEKSKLGDISFLSFRNGRKIEEINFNEWFDYLKEQKTLLDSKDECYQTANNNFFRKDTQGFISVLINELLIARAEMKKNLKVLTPGTPEYSSLRSSQATIKELANSMYGITGDKNSRYFNKNIAESITLTGQFLNRFSSSLVEEEGYPVIYGDTDSIFSPIPDDSRMEEFDEKINEKLKDRLKEHFHLTKSIVFLEYEKAYQRMIMLDKKRYTGLIKWVDGKYVSYIHSKGLEDVKKNTIRLTKNKMKELVIMITKENKTLEEVKSWLIELKDYVFSVENIDKYDIAISTNLSKPTTSYKTKLAHVVLAEKLIKRKIIQQPVEDSTSWGTRIVYIVESTKPSQQVTYIDDYTGVWDRDHYWDTLIFAPILRVLEVVWPEEDWAMFSLTELKKREKAEIKARKKLEKEALEIEKQKKRDEKAALKNKQLKLF